MKSRRIAQLPLWMRFVLGAVYFFIMAQYILNESPWERYCGLAALLCLACALFSVLAETHRMQRSGASQQNQ